MPRQTPQYRQLAEDLAARIAGGEFPVGSTLPTEATLCETHDVSRFTVREALRRLVDLGMVTRRARIGTQVVSTAPVSEYTPLAGSAEDIVTLVAGTRIVGGQGTELRADARLARRLGCSAGSDWFCFAGPRFIRGKSDPPVCWSEQYIRAEYPRDRLVRGTFTAAELASHTIEQTLSAEMLRPELADALGAARDSAALVVTRRHHTPRRKLVSVGIHTHPGERFQIEMRG